MRTVPILVIFFFILSAGTAQSIDAFIPENHIIMDSLVMDYNKDKNPDILILCKHTNEENPSDNINDILYRPFIILKGTGKNKYQQILRNDKLVLCNDCGGVFGDPFNGIEINKDTLILGHYGGSTWKWTKTAKFYYDRTVKNWVLIECSESSFNSFDIENTTEETRIRYTNDNFIKMVDYDIYEAH